MNTANNSRCTLKTIIKAEVMAEAENEMLQFFPTIHILQLVKDARQRHGLRHADYNRYRSYCRSKLKHVRRALKFTNTHKCVRRHKAKFMRRWVTDETFTDEKFVQLGLFEAERRWAKAMSDKIAMEDNPDKLRKRHSLRMNLKRAVFHAISLETLVKTSPKCDAPTKLEAQAYAAWLRGICCFELRKWHEAAEALKAARIVYDRLAEATQNTTLANLYKAKCREIQPQLRLCEFSSAESSPVEMLMNELIAIRMQGTDSDTVDRLIAEMRSKATSDSVVVIEWGGFKSTIEDNKTRQVIQGWKQIETELNQCNTPKEKIALYEKQLTDTRDALDRMSDLIRRKAAENSDLSVLQSVKTYLEFLKMTGTSAKYLAMIENTKSEKKTKPQDLLRLYDSVIEISKEIIELTGANADSDLIKAFRFKIEFYKTFRCYYMAAAYASLSMYNEASALFNRAIQRKESAINQMAQIKGNPYVTETEAALISLSEEIEQAKMVARINRMAAVAGICKANEETEKKIDDKHLLETPDDWREWDVTNNLRTKRNIPVVRQPPSFIPMPCKPIFFDLALNHVKMPNLDERLAKCIEGAKSSEPGQSKAKVSVQKKAVNTEEANEIGGLSGLVKGWFWGKK